MNVCRRPWVASAGRWWVVLGLVAVVSVASGCSGGGPPPAEGRLDIENVAKWYSLYCAENRGQAPPDESAFVEFVEETLKSRGQTVDLEQFLKSPRDGQKYVIQYGKPTSPNPERNVAVRESEGYGGTKLIAFESARSREVEEGELQALLSAE